MIWFVYARYFGLGSFINVTAFIDRNRISIKNCSLFDNNLNVSFLKNIYTQKLYDPENVTMKCVYGKPLWFVSRGIASTTRVQFHGVDGNLQRWLSGPSSSSYVFIIRVWNVKKRHSYSRSVRPSSKRSHRIKNKKD